MLRSEIIKVKKISELTELKNLDGYEDALLMLSSTIPGKIDNYNVSIRTFLSKVEDIINDSSLSFEELSKSLLEASLNNINVKNDNYINFLIDVTKFNNIPTLNINTSINLAKYNEETNTITDGLISNKELTKILNSNKWTII